MKIAKTLFLFLLLFFLTASAAETVRITPDQWMCVIGKKSDSSFFIPVRNKKKQFTMTLRTPVKPYRGRVLVQGAVKGKVRALFLMLMAFRANKKVYEKGLWLTGEKLLKGRDGLIHCGGILDLSNSKADRFYFYFQSFNGKADPVLPVLFTVTKQED